MCNSVQWVQLSGNSDFDGETFYSVMEGSLQNGVGRGSCIHSFCLCMDSALLVFCLLFEPMHGQHPSQFNYRMRLRRKRLWACAGSHSLFGGKNGNRTLRSQNCGHCNKGRCRAVGCKQRRQEENGHPMRRPRSAEFRWNQTLVRYCNCLDTRTKF